MKKPSAKHAPAKQPAVRKKLAAQAPAKKPAKTMKKKPAANLASAIAGMTVTKTRVTRVHIDQRAGTMTVTRQSLTVPNQENLHFRPAKHVVSRCASEPEIGAINHDRCPDLEETRSERSEDFARSDVPTPPSSPSCPDGADGGGSPPRGPQPSRSSGLRRLHNFALQ